MFPLRFVLLCFLALLLCGGPHGFTRAAELSVTFVPKEGTGQVPVEIVTPGQKAGALKKMAELQKLVGAQLRLERRGDRYTSYGKCIVEVRQQELGEAYFQVECLSFAMWPGDDPFMSLGKPSTPNEVMTLIDAFLVKHRERLVRPVPPKTGQALMT